MITVTIATLWGLIIGVACIIIGIKMITCDVDMALNFIGWICIGTGLLAILCAIGAVNIVV